MTQVFGPFDIICEVILIKGEPSDFDKRYFALLKSKMEKSNDCHPIFLKRNIYGRLCLKSGWYRLKAAKDLGWNSIPAYVEDEIWGVR